MSTLIGGKGEPIYSSGAGKVKRLWLLLLWGWVKNSISTCSFPVLDRNSKPNMTSICTFGMFGPRVYRQKTVTIYVLIWFQTKIFVFPMALTNNCIADITLAVNNNGSWNYSHYSITNEMICQKVCQAQLVSKSKVKLLYKLAILDLNRCWPL